MTQKMVIMRLEVVTDDDTGIYRVGELDWAIGLDGQEWVERHRGEFAAFLRDLSDRCATDRLPFPPMDRGKVRGGAS